MMSKQVNNSKTLVQLNQLLADLTQLQNNIQQIHWYMRGKNFFHLHPLMDEYKEILGNQLDELAERLIALGGSPFATIAEFSAHTKLPDEKIAFDQFTLAELMDKLLSEFKYLKEQYQIGIDVTDQEKDFPTQDILNGYKRETEKVIWMVSAYLNKGPLE